MKKAPQQTPAEALAARIVARLVKEKLLAKERAERFSGALASGKLKTGDWRLALEEVPPQKSKPAA